MSKLKDKIVNHAKTEYNSSPHRFDDAQIQLIIEHDCECDHCGKSIFELDDFPDVSVERKEVLCEECYDEEYRTTCPICVIYEFAKHSKPRLTGRLNVLIVSSLLPNNRNKRIYSQIKTNRL